MKVHRLETALTEKGQSLLQNLPFKKGDEVEIIVLERSSFNCSDSSSIDSTCKNFEIVSLIIIFPMLLEFFR